jgi:peptidoglycan/xylan/chitin deacetylase (PgdA/CDA1 family)
MSAKSTAVALDHLSSALDRLSFFNAYGRIRRKLTTQEAAIIVYHRVGPTKNDDLFNQPMSIDSFKKQIDYLYKNHTIISIDELISKRRSQQVPKNTVVITFDDGYKDNHTYAYPILEKYNIPATIYLTSGGIENGKLFWFDKVSYLVKHSSVEKIDIDGLGTYELSTEPDRSLIAEGICAALHQKSENEKLAIVEKMEKICQVRIPNDMGFRYYLTWEEVKEMELVNFGAHTVTHPILTRIPLETAKYEIIKSKHYIEEQIGKKITSFAYPVGELGDVNLQIINCVKEAGFNSAVSVYPFRLISSKDDSFYLGRIGVHEGVSMLKMQLCGFFGDLRQVWGK